MRPIVSNTVATTVEMDSTVELHPGRTGGGGGGSQQSPTGQNLPSAQVRRVRWPLPKSCEDSAQSGGLKPSAALGPDHVSNTPTTLFYLALTCANHFARHGAGWDGGRPCTSLASQRPGYRLSRLRRRFGLLALTVLPRSRVAGHFSNWPAATFTSVTVAGLARGPAVRRGQRRAGQAGACRVEPVRHFLPASPHLAGP